VRSVRVIATASLGAAVLVLSGCTSSGGSAPSSAPATSPGASTGNGLATQLAGTMQTALRKITSAHLAMDGGVLLGSTEGNFSFANGSATASDIMVSQGAQKTRVLTVGSTSYAMLPSGQNTSGKPWVKVDANSKNEFVRGVAGTLGLVKAASSLTEVAGLVSTATSVQDKGSTSRGHEYSVVLDPAKTSGTDLGALLGMAGPDPIPVTLVLDSSGRPVQVQVQVKLGSQPFNVTVDVTKYNAPVHITAPPASQVATQ
jgi:hypothetical protein